MPLETWLGMQVFDWNHTFLGRVRGAETFPRTTIVAALEVELSPGDWRGRIGLRTMRIPMARVFGIRRGALVLDCSFEELALAEARRGDPAFADRGPGVSAPPPEVAGRTPAGQA